jgi:hypothetical protein
MNAVVLIAAAAVLAAGGVATASDGQFPQDFHGLRLLGSSDGETSGPNRAKPLIARFGPYDTDAVVLVAWEGEVSYVKAHRLVHANIEFKQDGVARNSGSPNLVLAGSGSIRIARNERLFLVKGEQTTLSVDAGGDAQDAPMARARLVGTAIATSQ